MGRVVLYRLRADLRRRRSLIALTLLVAVLGGVVLATAAGARRTSSAYERLLERTSPPELLVSPPGGPGAAPDPFYAAVADLPGVRELGLIAGVPLAPQAGTSSEPLAEALGGIGVVAALDGSWSTEVGRPRLVSGRLPNPREAQEILITERFASQTGLGTGDHLDVVLLTESETDQVGLAATAEQGRPMRLTVTGVGVAYDEVVPFSDLNASGSILATAPLAELVPRADWNFEGAFVDVDPSADLAALTEEVERLGNDPDLGTGGPVFVSDEAAAARRVNESMQPLAVSLAVAAVAFGLVVLVVVGQAVARATREPPEEVVTLRAVGMRPVDRLGVPIGLAALVGTVGALGAIVVALALSSRFPIGVARVAEPDPGFAVDSTVLLVGALLIVAVTVASALISGLVRLRPRSAPPRASRLASIAPRLGMGPPAVQGVRFAASSDGTQPVPMRSTLAAVTLAVTAVVGTITFADSLVTLLDSPARYGQGWDRMLDAQFGPAPVGRVIDRVGASDEVDGIAVGSYGDVSVDGLPVAAFDLQPVVGDISVTILEGQPARAADEIVLGTQTMRALGVQVGSTVMVDKGEGPGPMRISGRGVFPHMGQGSFSTTGLGVGAQLPGGTLSTFFDDQDVPPDYLYDGRTFHFVAIDAKGSPSALDAELVELEASVAADAGFVLVRTEQPPTKILDLGRVRVVPMTMAGVLALVAVTALAHLLTTSVLERRRELALLSALGFVRRQLRATVAWQATVVTLASLAVGVPVGVALGRSVWTAYASGLHAAAPAETPWLWLALAVVASLGIANLVALLPGQWAGRTRTAVVLRTQ